MSKQSKINQTAETIETIRAIREGKANKLSPRHGGTLTYEIGQEETTNAVYLRLTENNPPGGLFSKAWVSLDSVASALEMLSDSEPFRSSAIQAGLTARNKNQAGFTCAALRAEGLLGAVAEKPFLHVKGHPIHDWLAAQTEAQPKTKASKTPDRQRKKNISANLFEVEPSNRTETTTEP